MLIMKGSTRKALVFLSLLLYLAATSAASLHAFPMSGLAISDTSSVTQVQPEQIKDSREPCHTTNLEVNDASGEQPHSAVCEVFCAVMAQALSIDYQSSLASSVASSKAAHFSKIHPSYQTPVEPRPPK